MKYPGVIDSMKYYLETNSLYQLRRIPEAYLHQCFTSVFALIEIIAGITEKDFAKRKAILTSIHEKDLIIDWAFPQEVMFHSFDAFSDYEYIEQRQSGLKELYKTVLASEDFATFQSFRATPHEFGFDFFVDMDQALTASFQHATNKGNTDLKRNFQEGKKELVNFKGKDYAIQTGKEMHAFFEENPEVNYAFTILSLANLLKKSFETELDEETIYQSYNGLMNPFVVALSKYTAEKACFLESSSRNDFQDLLHLLYLRAKPQRYIVSNDKLFQKYIPSLTARLVTEMDPDRQ